MIGIFVVVLILLIIYNITYYIPNKLKEQEFKQSLHFKELYIRLNKLESMIEEIKESKDK